MKPGRVGGSSICKASGWGGRVNALLPLRRPRKPTSAESDALRSRPAIRPARSEGSRGPPARRRAWAPHRLPARRVRARTTTNLGSARRSSPWGQPHDGCAVRSWIRPALGGQRPGHEHARGSCLRVGSSSEIRTQLAPTPTGGPYRGLCTDAMRPGATAPTGAGAPSRAPGRLPPMPCREVRDTCPRTAFTFRCSGGAYLPRWPPPRFTSVPQAQRARGGCHAWATIAS